MMFGLMRVRTHDAEMAKVRGERDQWKARAEERDEAAFNALFDCGYLNARNQELQSRLDALTPARGGNGRFAKREAVSNG